MFLLAKTLQLFVTFLSFSSAYFQAVAIQHIIKTKGCDERPEAYSASSASSTQSGPFLTELHDLLFYQKKKELHDKLSSLDVFSASRLLHSRDIRDVYDPQLRYDDVQPIHLSGGGLMNDWNEEEF